MNKKFILFNKENNDRIYFCGTYSYEESLTWIRWQYKWHLSQLYPQLRIMHLDKVDLDWFLYDNLQNDKNSNIPQMYKIERV